MKVLEILKKYSFHIFALSIFLIISIYKFYPKNTIITKSINSKPINSDSEYNSIEKNENTIIYVDLSGAVSKPGIYKMTITSRVGDLISQGGGFTKNASALWISRNLNLSKLLYDTQKIYVPFEWETYGDCTCAINSLFIEAPLEEIYSSNNNDTNISQDTTQVKKPIEKNNSNITSISNTEPNIDTATNSKVNINKASLEELDKLNGIGPAYASKISSNRPYSNFADLVSKSGIPETTLKKISELISY